MRKKFDEMRKEVHRGAAVITDGGGGCRPEVKGGEACLNKYSVNYALVGGKYSHILLFRACVLTFEWC